VTSFAVFFLFFLAVLLLVSWFLANAAEIPVDKCDLLNTAITFTFHISVLSFDIRQNDDGFVCFLFSLHCELCWVNKKTEKLARESLALGG